MLDAVQFVPRLAVVVSYESILHFLRFVSGPASGKVVSVGEDVGISRDDEHKGHERV